MILNIGFQWWIKKLMLIVCGVYVSGVSLLAEPKEDAADINSRRF